jgi:peptide alpha-N-acetyltransferase
MKWLCNESEMCMSGIYVGCADVSVFATEKPLLMLQSIKRAHRLDPNNPKLHSCLILCHGYLTHWQGNLEPSVATVLKQEMEPIFRGRDAHQMNAEFLAANKKSLEALFESECCYSL